MENLHPDLGAFADTYFNVDANDLDADVGRRCRVLDPRCVEEHEIFTIVCTQLNYRGDLIYRGVSDREANCTRHLPFGRPLSPDEIEFID